MSKRKTVYFSDLLKKLHPSIYNCLKTTLNKHSYEVKMLKTTKDIWIRDFMPIVTKDKLIQYQYYPDYFNTPKEIKYRTNPIDPIIELGLDTFKTDLVLDGGNVVKSNGNVIMTDKVFQENVNISFGDLQKIFPLTKLIIIPRDPDVQEIYGHADGMVRFISENHLLINSQYPDSFKEKLHTRLKDTGFKYTELKMKEDTKYAWGYINFMHLDGLIIQPSIDKINDEYVKSQLKELYPNTAIELCDAKALLKNDGGFNCVSWEMPSPCDINTKDNND